MASNESRRQPDCVCMWADFQWRWWFRLLIIISFPFPKQGNVEECELRVLLHQSLAGCVIGKGGSKIKELKDVSRNFFNYFLWWTKSVLMALDESAAKERESWPDFDDVAVNDVDSTLYNVAPLYDI